MSYSFTLREWESKSALLSHLEAIRARTVTIGLDSEAPRKFYSLSLSAESRLVEIAVASSDLGIMPSVVLLNKSEEAIVGHDTWLTGISLNTAQISFNKRLNGVFFEFVPVASDDEVVVVHELGIIRINSSGAEKWHIDTDIIEDFVINKHGNMHLTLMDQPSEVIVELESGRTLVR